MLLIFFLGIYVTKKNILLALISKEVVDVTVNGSSVIKSLSNKYMQCTSIPYSYPSRLLKTTYNCCLYNFLLR